MPSFAVQRIDHVVLRVADFRRSEAWDCDAIGCHTARRRGDLGLLHLRAGVSMIDLIAVNGPLGQRSGPQARNLDHLCLRIEPFDETALVAHLHACGIAPHGPAQNNFGAEGEGLSLYFSDPDGNAIELKGPSIGVASSP